MVKIDLEMIRRGIAALQATNHSATGPDKPRPDEIFAPEAHAGALDPNTILVLGARGTGKSFWAGVLGSAEGRRAAAQAYPSLGLERIEIGFGYTGLDNDGSASRDAVDAALRGDNSIERARLFWRCVALRALRSTVDPSRAQEKIRSMMDRYEGDPEQWELECRAEDDILAQAQKKVLILFDALDRLGGDWTSLRARIDALLEVAWTIRGYRSIRLKLFLRPDQMKNLGLTFVELPKIESGATNLVWRGTDLYGLLYSRLALSENLDARDAFGALLEAEGMSASPGGLDMVKRWPPAYDAVVQARILTRLAGAYMGTNAKRGRTYDWSLNHLGDGFGSVTPRSFMMLMVEAARRQPAKMEQAITPDGIRHGLRAASKVRVDELRVDFPWIGRALQPLANLLVPSTKLDLFARWEKTGTIEAIQREAAQKRFLPPAGAATTATEQLEALAETLVQIGVLAVREDRRYDMPDLFRVAASLLKRGGVTPRAAITA